jgi:hypothetical protein
MVNSTPKLVDAFVDDMPFRYVRVNVKLTTPSCDDESKSKPDRTIELPPQTISDQTRFLAPPRRPKRCPPNKTVFSILCGQTPKGNLRPASRSQTFLAEREVRRPFR